MDNGYIPILILRYSELVVVSNTILRGNLTYWNLRRSIFYRKNVSKGTKLKLNDLEIKSPGIGLHPKEIGQIVGKTIIKSVKKDFPVSWEDIKNWSRF